MRILGKKPSQSRKPSLSGKQSSTFSYHAAPRVEQSQKPKSTRLSKSKLIWWLMRLPTAITIIVVIVGIVYGLSLDPNNPRLIIESPENGKTSLLRPDIYEAATKKAFQTLYLIDLN
jgi:hypothetical protein